MDRLLELSAFFGGSAALLWVLAQRRENLRSRSRRSGSSSQTHTGAAGVNTSASGTSGVPRLPDAAGPLSASDLKAALSAIAREYMLSVDISEARRRLTDMRRHTRTEASQKWSDLTTEAVKRAVYVAYEDSSPRGAELVATLLSGLVLRGVLPQTSLRTGLKEMAERLTDSLLDTPRAADVLADVIAQLVMDDTLPEAVTQELPESVRQAVRDRVSDAVPHPLAQVRAMYHDIVAAYLRGELGDWDDFDVFKGRVASLNARHTLHELVFCVAEVLCEAREDALTCERASTLLRLAVLQHVVSSSAAIDGCLRVLRSAPTLIASASRPDAADTLGRFLGRAVADGVLPDDFLRSVPDLFSEMTSPRASSSATSTDDSALPPISRAILRAQRSSDGTWLMSRSPSHDEPLAAATSPVHSPDNHASAAAVSHVLNAATRATLDAEIPGGTWNYSGASISAMRQGTHDFATDFILVDAAEFEHAAKQKHQHAIHAVQKLTAPSYRTALLYTVLRQVAGQPAGIAAQLGFVIAALLESATVTADQLWQASAAALHSAAKQDSDAADADDDEAKEGPVQAALMSTLLAVLVPLVRGGTVAVADGAKLLEPMAASNAAAATVLRRLRRL